LTDTDPAKLWKFCLQLPEVEAAFKDWKWDLVIRPIHLKTKSGWRRTPSPSWRPGYTSPWQGVS
jgi:hypothetical protein